MQLKLRPSSPRQCRRRLAAALTLVGAGLVAAAATQALAGSSPGSYIDQHQQSERALPAPSARAVSLAVSAQRRFAGAVPRTTRTAATTKAKRPVWRQMPPPVRIVIPAIRVSAPIIPLGLNRDRTIEVPRSFSVAGWFRPGPEPGEKGAAVILGHVDSKSGPGVFYRLRALRRGDRIKIAVKNRKRVLQYVVTSTKEVPKKHFPTKLVYARTAGPTLRIVTCDGRFNRATGHYVDNFIVFAWLVGRP